MKGRAAGFTLIELMVVLVILGLTSALVLPKFPAIYEQFTGRAEQESFFQSLGVLTLKAYTQQKPIVLNQTTATELLGLPSGWELKIEKPIIYKANGFCLGGNLSYTAQGITTVIKLLPPYCEVSR